MYVYLLFKYRITLWTKEPQNGQLFNLIEKEEKKNKIDLWKTQCELRENTNLMEDEEKNCTFIQSIVNSYSNSRIMNLIN